MPAEHELGAFYESRYRDVVDPADRAPDLARLVKTGPDAERERAWLAHTLHADVLAAAEAAAAEGLPRRVLDIGAGTGDLVLAFDRAGWDAIGIDPAAGLADAAHGSRVRIEGISAMAFVGRWRARRDRAFSAITLMNVLEHVPQPAAFIEAILEALLPGGRLIVRVPNDFSPLQEAARSALERDPWWIVIPDHVNYFDHATIAALLVALGLEIVDQSADYPMELFLLGGEDYTSDPAVGARVHERRRRMELAMPAGIRRQLGRAWAATGIGRNAFVVARRPAP